MSEIRFRVWDGEKMHYPGDRPEAFEIMLMMDGSINVVVPEKHRRPVHMLPMLSTGLKDKNGREIFDGDVYICDYTGPTPHLVKYGNQDIGHDWQGIGFYSTYKMIYREDVRDIIDHPNGGQNEEVIGNIHENPELLEVSDE